MLLLDTDMLVLLVASGTLERISQLLGHSLDQVRRLPAAIHQIRKSRTFRDNYGESVLQRIAPDVEKIPEAPAPDDVELLDSLHEVVDVGEAQLMALASSCDCSLLLSGDKRAIADLAASDAHDCIKSLQGRIVTLEAVLWILVSEDGAAAVRSAFSEVLGYRTLRIVLGSNAPPDDQTCLDGVRSYFNDTASKARGLLFKPSSI